MVGERHQSVFLSQIDGVFESDRRFEFRRIRDIRVRDSESRLYALLARGVLCAIGTGLYGSSRFLALLALL